MIKRCIVLMALLLSLLMSQVVGPEIPSRNFEIGFFQKYFHRDMGWEITWQIPSIYIRYGLFNCLTLSVEGLVTNSTEDIYTGRDYRHYTIGGGITFYTFCCKNFHIAVSFHYNERISFDRSVYSYHKNTRGIIGALQIEREFKYNNHSVVFWLGPAYVFDECFQNIYGHYDAYHVTSDDNFGAILGANCVLFKRISVFGHIIYADYLQSRYGFGYRF